MVTDPIVVKRLYWGVPRPEVQVQVMLQRDGLGDGGGPGTVDTEPTGQRLWGRGSQEPPLLAAGQ